MGADPLGDRLDPRLAPEIDGDASGAREGVAIKLQPARRAPSRQPPVGDRDVCLGAGVREGLPVDPVGRACGDDVPGRLSLRDDSYARVLRTVAIWPRAEISDVAVETR